MERKYELVAWTKNITDAENARLYVSDPQVGIELLEPFLDEVAKCRREQMKNGGEINVELARRFVKVYEDSARLDLFMGNVDFSIHSLIRASGYCTMLPHEFVRLRETASYIADTYGFKHVLREMGITDF